MSAAPLKKRLSYRAGLWAEHIAACYLAFIGYKVLAKRWRTYGGEADIVAKKGKVIVIAEVKFRRRKEAAAYSITPRQQARLMRSGEYALSRFGGESVRFDAMLFSFDAWPRHLRNVIT